MWPNLVRFLSRGANTEAKGIVGEVEVAMGMARAAKAAGSSLDWDMILKDAQSSQPTCKEAIPALLQWVKLFAGGIDAPLAYELSAFIKAYPSARQKRLGKDFLEAMLKIRPFEPGLAEHKLRAISSLGMEVENKVPRLYTRL